MPESGGPNGLFNLDRAAIDDPLYRIRRVLRRGAEHYRHRLGALLADIEAGDEDGQVTAAWVAAQELRAIYRCRDRDQAAARLYNWTVTCIDFHVPELRLAGGERSRPPRHPPADA